MRQWRSIAVITVTLGVGFTYAQNSLWKDVDPYRESKGPGDIITLKVNQKFIIDTDDRTTGTSKREIKLNPDTVNLPFLNPSTQSRSLENSGKSRYRLRETLRFSVAVQLGQPQPNSSTLPITGSVAFDIDSKPGRINITGEVDPRAIRNGVILSQNVLNLNLTVRTETPFPQDNSVNLKPPLPEGQTPPEPPRAQLSPQEEQQVLLRHLRRILGGQQ